MNTELNNIATSFQEPVTSNERSNSLAADNQLLKTLVAKCLGDYQKAERLIEYERQRSPELDRESAIQAAITRWERDNR